MNLKANAYLKSGLEARVMGASPHDLTLMLYKKLNEKLGLSISCLKDWNIDETHTQANIGFHESSDHVIRIAQSFKNQLDPTHDQELAQQLSYLYDFIIFQVREAIKKKDISYLENASEIASDLENMWATIPADLHEKKA